MRKSCVIIGAGIAGIIAARVLRSAGIETVILEKSGGIGGRMATRRIDDGVFDHGAQFITVQTQWFQQIMDECVAAGCAKKWCNSFPGIPVSDTATERVYYCGVSGMTDIPKFLADELTIIRRIRVASCTISGTQWMIAADDGTVYTADALVCTAPIPQSRDLFSASGIAFDASFAHSVLKSQYDPCFAVLALLKKPSTIPAPGGIYFADGPMAWIGDNHQKGISPTAHAVTIHASREYSRLHFDKDKQEVGRDLLKHARDFCGLQITEFQVHRWRYSTPLQSFDAAYGYQDVPAPLALAGDGFTGGRIESAAMSGFQAGKKIAAVLNA